jgi:hydrogenase expression/formation protein HypD
MHADFSHAWDAADILARCGVRNAVLMEVCGTHTMAIAKSGLRTLLPPGVRLVSGPGCPVCVTAASALDAAMAVAHEKNVTLAVYGDMLRVPGSNPSRTLLACRAGGADVRTVFSAADAVTLAQEHPDRRIVLLGVGFETTAAGTAAAVVEAHKKHLSNFFVLSLLKRLEPALTRLLQRPDTQCDGLLLPGHVATIIGEKGFSYLPALGIPGVITGFEPGDILAACAMLLTQIAHKNVQVQNEYTRAVRPSGNPAAQRCIAQALTPCDDVWRGLGCIPDGGFALAEPYAALDAWRVFGLDRLASDPPSACACADVITARIAPHNCPLFGQACTPTSPMGPCMVSSEGACAAAWKYENFT